MLNHLEPLCCCNGISGNEDTVRNYITAQLDAWQIPYVIDPLGNVIAEKNGINSTNKKLMISAHMDEVGCIVTYINEDGTLQIAPVGGIDPSVVIGRQVILGDNPGIPAVIGATPIHLLSKEQRTTPIKFSDLFADCGASDKETAQKLAPQGTPIYFQSAFDLLGGECVRSKALDDRVGCAILLDLLAEETQVSFTAAFLVQEEIGLRGAHAAAYTVAPDVAIILEGTTASDCADAQGDEQVCCLGKGPVISFMDRATVYDRELYQLAGMLCKAHELPWQTKSKIAGGNDSGAIHVSRGGVRTLAVSVPCRYIHSPASVADLRDIRACETLIKLLIEKVVQ